MVATLVLLTGFPLLLSATEETGSTLASGVIDDQQYNRAIHIMAMLLIGFGFLMVFVRK
jgi:ammonium transporter Rh